jgi:HK97 family phage major capsid protein
VNTQQQRLEQLAAEGKGIIDRAELEGRGRTADEDLQIAQVIREIDRVKATAAVDQIGRQIGVESYESFIDGSPVDGRPGDVFVKSEQYRKISDPQARASRWSSGPVEVPYRRKADLLEGELGSPGTGGALVQSDVRPGLAPILFQPLTVADRIPSAQTTSNKVRTLVETVASPGSIGVVPEAGEKPEASLEFDEVDEPVKKIASFLPVSDELLSDTPGIQAYLNSRLSLFVRQEEEAQLLGGAGGDNFLGLMPRVPDANKYVSSDADTPNAADHIYEGITVARRSFLEPDTVVIHPVDWADLRLLKDDNLNYIGGSPFSNTGAGEPGEFLWNKRVLVTTAMTPGAALVGAFATGAQIFRRGGLTVEASNSHDDWFKTDMVAIRAETRLALCVLRPESFVLVDLGYAS